MYYSSFKIPAIIFVKGHSNEIFGLHFFHYSNLHGPLTNRLKYFKVWLRFRGVIKILGLNKMTRRREIDLLGYVTQGVMFWRIFY